MYYFVGNSYNPIPFLCVQILHLAHFLLKNINFFYARNNSFLSFSKVPIMYPSWVMTLSLKYFNHRQIILSIEFLWQMELVTFISDQLPKISVVIGPFVVVCYILIWSKFTLFHLFCHILATCIWLSFEVHLSPTLHHMNFLIHKLLLCSMLGLMNVNISLWSQFTWHRWASPPLFDPCSHPLSLLVNTTCNGHIVDFELVWCLWEGG